MDYSMIEPLVSIIVTCYNHEDYIKECLNSIYKQNYSNIELLILNDGSTDSSINQINQSIVNSPFQRTYLYSHSNQGVVYTRNKGIELAKVTIFFLSIVMMLYLIIILVH